MSKINHTPFNLAEIDMLRPYVPEIIEELGHEQETIEIMKSFTEGKSDALVYSISLSTPAYKGYAVLKCQPNEADGRQKEDELNAFNELQKLNPEFVTNYCPKLIFGKPFGGIKVLIFSLVGGSKLSATSLNISSSFSDRLKVLGRVSSSLLEDFQVGNEKVIKVASIGTIITDSVEKQIRPNSRIRRFIQALIDSNKSPSIFYVSGKTLPNPIHFLSKPLFTDELERLSFWQGWIHGDLHDHNIFFGVRGVGELDHFFIDFAFANPNGYLFYDHSYLEINQLWRFFKLKTLAEWVGLLETVSLSENDNNVNIKEGQHEALQVSSLIWERPKLEIKKENEGVAEDLRSQILIMRIIVGLNFANKSGLDNKHRLFCLVYSSFFLKQLLDLYIPKWESDDRLSSPILINPSKISSISLTESFSPPLPTGKISTSQVLSNGQKVWGSDELSQTENWHEIYRLTNNFNSSINILGLIIPEESEKNLFNIKSINALAFIRWAFIIDFNNSLVGLNELQSEFRGNVALHDLMPKDINSLRSIDMNRSLIWLSLNGKSHHNDEIELPFLKWRQKYLPLLRGVLEGKAGKQENKSASIVVYIPENGLTEKEMRTIETIEEALPDTRFIFFSDFEPILAEYEKMDNVTTVSCSFKDLTIGLDEIFSPIQKRDMVIRIPKRYLTKDSKIGIETFQLDNQTHKWLDEFLEVVHPEIIFDPLPENRKFILDFWKGYEISWQDLHSNADVERHIYKDLFKHIYNALSGYRNERVSLYHNAGAGGTTLGKRIAWEMKGFFPTVMIRKFSEYLDEQIGELYKRSDLPVFVIVEGSIVSTSEMDRLYHKLKENNIRSVLLYIQRTSQKKKHKFSLYDPFPLNEVDDFIDKFKSIRPQSITTLQKTLKDDSLRSPFFFGLTAFDKEYKKLPDYIKHHLLEVKDPWEKEFLINCSIFTFFSQAHMPSIVASKMAKFAGKAQVFPSAGLQPLIKNEERGIRVIHPRVAEEILNQCLSDSQQINTWRTDFHYRVMDFFDTLEEVYQKEYLNPESQDFLINWVQQVFITRDPITSVDGTEKRNFSELINNVSNDEAKMEIFEKITTIFPNQAHFWNHKGRLKMHALSEGNFEKAQEYVKKAIELEDTDPLHYHTLGMVYRKEIYSILDRRRVDSYHLSDSERVEETLETLNEIKGLINLCQESFEESLYYNESNEYAYVSNIQMIIKVVTGLKSISKVDIFQDFLKSSNEIETFTYGMLSKAEELITELKKLVGEHRKSNYISTFEDDMLKIVGNYDELIKGLNSRLNSYSGEKHEIRRSLASAIFVGSKRSWNSLSKDQLEKVSKLALNNHRERQATAYDYWLWINAYRRSEVFEMNTAIEVINTWRNRENTLEGTFYLYVLKYLLYRQKIITDPAIIKELIQECKDLSRNRSEKTTSMFWLSQTPEWCPIIHPKDLGGWDIVSNFWKKPEYLLEVSGRILKINSPQSGKLLIDSIEAFFVPGTDKKHSRDVNRLVKCYIGFSYDGLRAWNVRIVD